MITVRRMEERDAAAAARLEAENFSMPWSEQAFLETLRCDYAYYYVAEWDEFENEGSDIACRFADDENLPIIGMCGLRNIAGEGEITNVAVSKSHRRKGIAQALLQRALADGTEMGMKAFTLEVRAGNAPAVALYEKFGFEGVGVRKHFYSAPTEDALIMWKRQET